MTLFDNRVDLPSLANWWRRRGAYPVAAFTAITLLVILVPLLPNMPTSGLDPSWRLAMNAALAQHLKIGKDIVFTFGPYSSLYTWFYHPATASLMLWGAIALALCYFVCLYTIERRSRFLPLLGLLLFLTIVPTDTTLLTYPLLLIVWAQTLIPIDQRGQRHAMTVIGEMIVVAPLGLLPLIKGSLIAMSCVTIVLLSLYFFAKRDRQSVLIVLCTPIMTMTLLWAAAGQPLLNLPEYFRNISSVISGYSEAAALTGPTQEIMAFGLSAIIILLSVITCRTIDFHAKLFISAGVALFLFSAFKAGFVRQDGHAIIAGASLVVAALALSFIYVDVRIMAGLGISLLSWGYVGSCCHNPSPANIWLDIRTAYARALEGVALRATAADALGKKFEQSLAAISSASPLPTLNGTTDIYSYDQAELLASGNTWNPRPVFQSYSVNTSRLAQLNERHLRSSTAPDNILFRLQPLDDMLPSIQDGLSWPALIDNYSLVAIKGDLAYLKRRPDISAQSKFEVVSDHEYRLGEDVVAPDAADPIFAEIDIKPTLLGSLATLLFKPPQLGITLLLRSEKSEHYRLISTETSSGFVISPLIHDIFEFGVLQTGNHGTNQVNFVKKFAIGTSRIGEWFWQSKYRLKLKTFHPETIPLPGFLVETIYDGMPDGYSNLSLADCDDQGAVDLVNGLKQSPRGGAIVPTSQLSVLGWLAVSAKDGIIPDKTFVVLTNATGENRFVPVRIALRPDVKDVYKQPALVDAGFSATIDVRALHGDYVVGIARGYKGKLEQCAGIRIPIKFPEHR